MRFLCPIRAENEGVGVPDVTPDGGDVALVVFVAANTRANRNIFRTHFIRVLEKIIT